MDQRSSTQKIYTEEALLLEKLHDRPEVQKVHQGISPPTSTDVALTPLESYDLEFDNLPAPHEGVASIGDASEKAAQIENLARNVKGGLPFATIDLPATNTAPGRKFKLAATLDVDGKRTPMYCLGIDDSPTHFAFILHDGTVLDSGLDENEPVNLMVDEILSKMLAAETKRKDNEPSGGSVIFAAATAAVLAFTLANSLVTSSNDSFSDSPDAYTTQADKDFEPWSTNRIESPLKPEVTPPTAPRSGGTSTIPPRNPHLTTIPAKMSPKNPHEAMIPSPPNNTAATPRPGPPTPTTIHYYPTTVRPPTYYNQDSQTYQSPPTTTRI